MLVNLSAILPPVADSAVLIVSGFPVPAWYSLTKVEISVSKFAISAAAYFSKFGEESEPSCYNLLDWWLNYLM